MNKHLFTSKHIKNEDFVLKTDYEKKYSKLTCNICKKSYTARNSFWYHKKKCLNNSENMMSY